MNNRDHSTGAGPADCEAQAADTFIRRQDEDWTAADERAFQSRLSADAPFARAVETVEKAWQTLGSPAAAPRLMALRDEAMARARQASTQRRSRLGVWGWGALAASVAAAAVILGSLQLSGFGFDRATHQTGIGEQRVLNLEDHSQIVLDARTRVRVRFSAGARVVQLLEGQAQFSVAADPRRPFQVQAGDTTIFVLGTVFTVEYAENAIQVATLEGKIAVQPAPPEPASAGTESSASASAHRAAAPGGLQSAGRSASASALSQPMIELTAGKALRIENGHATVLPDVDLDAAVAWREGKLIFDKVPLTEAVRQINRYSRWQLEIDDESIGQMRISGVFETGDARAFVEALPISLPVMVDERDRDVVHLKRR